MYPPMADAILKWIPAPWALSACAGMTKGLDHGRER